MVSSAAVPSSCPLAFICSVRSVEAGVAVAAHISAAALRRLRLMEQLQADAGSAGRASPFYRATGRSFATDEWIFNAKQTKDQAGDRRSGHLMNGFGAGITKLSCADAMTDQDLQSDRPARPFAAIDWKLAACAIGSCWLIFGLTWFRAHRRVSRSAGPSRQVSLRMACFWPSGKHRRTRLRGGLQPIGRCSAHGLPGA